MSTETQFHELTYMQRSLELANVKEEIEKLHRDRHFIDKKIEEKTHLETDLTEKCIRHLQVLRRKGATPDSYCPKKRGVTSTPIKSRSPYTTPTKPYTGNHAPNYFPSPRAYMSGAEHALYGKNLTSPLPRHRVTDNYTLAGPSPRNPVASPQPFMSGPPNRGPNFSSTFIPQDNNRPLSKPDNIGQQCMIGLVSQLQPTFPHQPVECGVAQCNTLPPGAQNMAMPFNVPGGSNGRAIVTGVRNVAQPINAAGNCAGGVTVGNAGLVSNTSGMGSDGGVDNWDDGDQLTEAELINYVAKEDGGGEAGVNDSGAQEGNNTAGNCPADVCPSAGNDAENNRKVSVGVDEGCSDIASDGVSGEHTAGNGADLDGVKSATRKLFT